MGKVMTGLTRRPSNASQRSIRSPLNTDLVRVYVGPGKKEFIVQKKLLTASSDFFRERLNASPTRTRGLDYTDVRQQDIWLENECPEMFALFCLWLCQRGSFLRYVDQAVAKDESRNIHWNLIKLHTFAARINLPSLQDTSMDALQDVYLRCNWDLSPKVVIMVYTQYDIVASDRLRKWTVAMTAWTLNGMERPGVAEKFHALLETLPEFLHDYNRHLRKMKQSKLDIHFKNPQLRLPSNQLRSEERQFGFRQCSFHTHRSSVGQGRCPHAALINPATPLVQSPFSDSSFESGSDTFESAFAKMVSPACESIFESDLER